MTTEQAQATIIGLGEVLWDCFGDERHPGGAPANVAYHASQLGLNGVACSRVGRDELGDELLQYLGGRGLDTRYIQRDATLPTGKVTVETTQADNPRYTIHENAAWDALAFDADWAELFRDAAAVCFGTLAQRSDSNRRVIEQACNTATQALVVYDVNLRPPFYEREWIVDSLGRAHVVKLNVDEVASLTELLDFGEPEPARFAQRLLERYALRTVCITRGADGCIVVSADEAVEVAGRRVKVADTVGAGDAFTAALTYGLIHGRPLRATTEFANEVGALVAGRAGAMPELRTELAALRAKFSAANS
jgi:fructokinase